MLTTAVGNKLLEDEDALVSGNKRIERNSHDHHSHGHENGHHGGEEVDLLDFFQQVGVRLTDGKDREGADDLGNGKCLIRSISMIASFKMNIIS
jgi:hypothetical protein